MAELLEASNLKEFEKFINEKTYDFSKFIVEGILSNLDTKKNYIHILSVKCEEESATYDLTLEKKDFAETLQENLKYYIEKEHYEACDQIVKTINELNK